MPIPSKNAKTRALVTMKKTLESVASANLPNAIFRKTPPDSAPIAYTLISNPCTIKRPTEMKIKNFKIFL